MDRNILDQLDIKIAKLLQDDKRNNNAIETPPALEAQLKNELPVRSNCTASLLHIDITAKDIDQKKISSILELISKNFESVTVFIDIQLALLVYSIIMPYTSAQQLQSIVRKRKSDWLSKNMTLIGKLEIPWSIVTNEEQSIQKIKNSSIMKLNYLVRSNCTFRHGLQQDIQLLKSYLLRSHSLPTSLYNQAKNKNDLAIKSYLVSRIATITALGNYKSAYISLNQMNSYLFLYKTSAMHNMPQFLTLSFIPKLPDSKELNNKLHKIDFLNKISEQKLYMEKAVSYFPGHIYLQAKDHTILACNKNQVLSFGVDDTSYFEGKKFRNFLPKTDADRLSNTAEEVMLTQKTKILIEESQYLGKNLPFISMKMLLRNKKNKAIGIMGFSIQIEKQDNTKGDNIMQSVVTNTDDEYINELKNNILMMPGNVMWYDMNGKILGCNQSQANLLDIDSPEAITEKSYYDFLIPEHIESSKQVLLDIFATKKPITTEEIYRTANSFKVIVSNKTPIEDNNGNIIGIMALAIDMSHENQHKINIAHQKEKLAMVKDFTNQFVHNVERDMRQPFVKLCSMTENYASQEEDLSKKSQLYEISNCAKDLLSYCDWLSELSNYASPDQNKNLISIKKLTKKIIDSNLTEIKDKNLDFTLDYDNKIPEKLLGDSYRIKRILRTLVTNSVKYTQSGYIRLSIELCAQNTPTILFSVTDSGSPISKNNYQHISTEKCSFSGKCICLNEIKRFVADLGGTITVDGSCIAVKLSFENIEDTGEIRKVDNIASELGMYSKNAAKSSSILSILKDEHFDIVLLDIGLEEIDGYTLARQIRDFESKYNHEPTKIVVITSKRCQTRSRIAKELNITDYFIEKSKVAEITNTIKESLSTPEACPA